MAYLHNSSDVSVHGKLRSCNCLIDGRFVLKISDFGLRTLTTPSEYVKDQNFFNSKLLHQIPLKCFTRPTLFLVELLWVAPELLPMTFIPGTPATQKGMLCENGNQVENSLIIVTGDVYSFAIILEEIVVRGGPYETARQYLDSKGLIAPYRYRNESESFDWFSIFF